MLVAFSIVFLALLSSAATALTASDYFPFALGDSWEISWQDNSGDSGTETQTVGSTVSLCGKDARRISATYGDDIIFNDSAGVGIVEIKEDDTTVRFCNDTLLVLPSNFTVGTQVTSSGDLTVTIVGEGSGTVPYTATSTVLASETVSVPAGTFETFKVHASANGSGNVPGVGFSSVTARYTWWVAKGIGVVQEEAFASISAPGLVDESSELNKLLETNLDSDGDLIGRAFDNCPNLANADQADLDADGNGDLCDDDIDGDGESNADEVLAGTDPYDPRSSTRARNATIISILQQLLGD
jgi:hypothetical protein